jgi:trans-aconitate methyltransferase
MFEETPEQAGARLNARQTFDTVADLYADTRPGYPAALFDDVIEKAGLAARVEAQTDTTTSNAPPLLEIGCGTGQATLDFALRGLSVDCVELGANLAAQARRQLAAFPRVRVHTADFETWTTERRYRLVYSATAYHWLNPATRQQQIATLLKPGGWLAIWHSYPVRGAAGHAFAEASQAIYTSSAPALAARFRGLPEPSAIPCPERDQLATLGIFSELESRTYCWQQRSTAEEFVRRTATYSDHQLLAPTERTALLEGLARLIDEQFGGSVVTDHVTVLHMARKCGGATA